jgi:hypothetical protein
MELILKKVVMLAKKIQQELNLKNKLSKRLLPIEHD